MVQTATGRRKEAVARVRLVPGTGDFQLNGRTLDEYFTTRAHRMVVSAPLRLAGREKELDVIARIEGGGVSGQAGALRLGMAGALIGLDPELRADLKGDCFAGPVRRAPQVRAEEGSQGAAILQALGGRPPFRPGSYVGSTWSNPGTSGAARELAWTSNSAGTKTCTGRVGYGSPLLPPFSGTGNPLGLEPERMISPSNVDGTDRRRTRSSGMRAWSHRATLRHRRTSMSEVGSIDDRRWKGLRPCES